MNGKHTFLGMTFGSSPWAALLLLSSILVVRAQEKVTFTDHILPLVEAQCAKCHNPDKKKGDLDLTSYSGAMKGGGAGVIVVSGNPDSSKLIKVLAHSEEPAMPPNKPPMAEKELAVFKKWIAGGLLETSGSKAIAAAKPAMDLTLKVSSLGKPDGPPPMPGELPVEPVVHTSRGYAINGLASSPWAPLVAITGQKQILLYHTTNFSLLGILPFPDGQPVDLKFSRSGKLLIAGGGHGAKSGKVILWNVETGERIASIGNEYDSVLATDISPDQSRVALGGPDRLVKIFSTKSGEVEHKIKKHTDWVTALAFSPNGEMLASADRNGGITVWDADSGQELFTTLGHKGAVTALSWRSDSRLVASSSEDGTVKLWESSEGKQAKTWNAHSGGVESVAYSQDGQFVTCGRDGAVITWSADGNKLKTCEFFGETATRCAWSDNATRIIAADFAGRVAVWEAKTGGRLGELDANPRLLADQLADAGKKLAGLQSQQDKPSPDVVAAEAELAKTSAALDDTKSALAKAKVDQEAKEQEVVRLKELTSQQSAPANLDEQLVRARAARQTARETTTNTLVKVESLTAAHLASRRKAEETGRANDKAALLAKAKTEVEWLRDAERRTTLAKARESIATRHRETTGLEAALEQKQADIAQFTKDVSSVSNSEAKGKAKAALKAAQAELKTLESQLKKARTDLATEQARLDKLSREHGGQKAAADKPQQQSKR